MGKLVRIAASMMLVPCGLLAADMAQAQQGTVSGRVTSASTGEPVEGASVLVSGTDLGALTAEDGTYRVTGVPPGPVTLIVQRLGYRRDEQTATVTAGEAVQVDFALATSTIALEAIVASVEAGAVQRKELGTDIARIDATLEVERGAVGNLTDLINARAENVTISQGSGQVGVASRVRVRGATSLTQDNVPLIIVDGIRYSNNTQIDPTRQGADAGGAIDTGGQTTGRFDDLNPHDIQSVEVVKGPTAAALYGSEAAAGVLVITTKRGEEADRPSFRLRTRNGFVEDNNDYPDNYGDLTTGFGVTDPADSRLQGFRTAQNPVTGMVFAIDNPLMDADSRPFRRGYQGTFGGSVSGGMDVAQYFGSLEYQTMEGVFRSNEMERFRVRANVGVQPSSVLDISLSTSYVAHDLEIVDTSTREGMVVQGVLGAPVNAFGDDPAPGQGPCLFDVLTQGSPSNPCANRNGTFTTTFENIELIEQGEDLQRFTGSSVVQVRPTSWLTLNATGGVDEYHRHLQQLIPFNPEGVFGGNSRGLRNSVRQRVRLLTADVGGTARFDLSPRLASTTSVGAQLFTTRMEISGCEGDTFASTQISTCDGALFTSGLSDLLENVELGSFFQQRIGLDGWLFGAGAVRLDDNSALGEETGVIVSPSANASIVLSDAPFWGSEFFDVLRLRFAWGKASQSPHQFAGARTFLNAPAIVDGQATQGLTASDPGNPELNAERSEEFEAGVEAEILEGRLAASFTYYNMTTRDAIVPVPVPPSSGFPNERFVNLAETENKGIEASISARVLEKENVDWDVRFVLSTSDPIVTDIGRETIFFPSADVGTTRAGQSQVFATGLAPGTYVSPVVESATRDEDGNITAFTLAPEDPRVGLGKRVVGSPVVTNEQSLSTTLTLFRNLRIFTLFDRDGGNDLLFSQQAFRSPLFTASPSSPTSSFSRRWAFRQTETPERQAEIEEGFIGPYIFDGSYIRWRELTVSYQVPAGIAGRFGLENASITLGGRNLRVFTDYPGIDPEGNIQGGQDNFVRSSAFEVGIPQTWFGELRVTF